MRRTRWPRITRDAVLFTTGLALTINEAVFEKAERPTLLMLFAGMMGLPVFLRKDEKDPPDKPSRIIVP